FKAISARNRMSIAYFGLKITKALSSIIAGKGFLLHKVQFDRFYQLIATFAFYIRDNFYIFD
uniref:hypothetical protein n=1 Tax=Cyclobacterium amurskyense TaxID=320787 RepID=UPI0030DC71D6